MLHSNFNHYSPRHTLEMARGQMASIVLVLFWDYLLYLHDVFIRYFAFATVSSEMGPSTFALLILTYIGFLSFPFVGLLADVWIGRHKAILIGCLLCFASWIMGGLGYVVYGYHSSEALLWTIYIAAMVLQVVGFTNFRANIVQYNVDQFIGASSSELHVIICCHAAIVPIVNTICQLTYCLFDGEVYNVMVNFIVSGVAIALVLVSHSFLKLENVSLIKNPIKLIVRVLCYARKHKYPENRSALTYWEEEAPSRLDLGKDKYGGPFTEEEVEDVKTFFRMLPLFIALVGFACSDEHAFHAYHKMSLLLCDISNHTTYFTISVILLVVYLLIIRVCFYKYIPRMLVRITVGLLLTLAVSVSYLIIFNSTGSHYTSKLIFVPQSILGASYLLMIPTSLEFTVAQSPVHMRGVMVGLWFASLGIGYLCNVIMAVLLFHCQNVSNCTSFYYYLAKSIFVLTILIIFVILARRYKYRVRENEANIYQIVDNQYDLYMQQEDNYHNNEA